MITESKKRIEILADKLWQCIDENADGMSLPEVMQAILEIANNHNHCAIQIEEEIEQMENN